MCLLRHGFVHHKSTFCLLKIRFWVRYTELLECEASSEKNGARTFCAAHVSQSTN